MNIQQRAHRQTRLIRRILILTAILLLLGTPYCTIIVLDALSVIPAPRYAHRVGFLFIGIAAGCIMLMMIYFTHNLPCLIFGRKKNRTKYQLRSGRDQEHARDMFKQFGEIVQSEITAGNNPLI